MKTNNTYLHFVAYKGLGRWDVKSLRNHHLHFAFPCCTLGQVLSVAKTTWVNIEDNKQYPILGVHAHGEGVYINNISKGKDLTMKKYQKSLPNHLFYCKVRTVNGQWGVVYPQYADSYGSSNMQYLAIDTNKVIPEYLECLLKIRSLTNEWDKNAIGADGRHFPLRTLLNLQIPLPSLAEQQALVDAYNHNLQQATELDQKAENGEKEIESTFADTLGIIKHSPQTFDDKYRLLFANYAQISQWGVDFILHGSKEVRSSKYPCKSIETLCRISSGGTPNRGRKEYFDGNIPWIKTGELRNEILIDTEEKITEAGLANSSAKLYPKGSLAIAMYGATIGKTAKLGIDATTNQACAVLTRIKEDVVLTDYLWLYLQTQTENLKAMAYGGAQPNINAGIIASYKIPLPPLDVQAEIVAEVQAKRAKIAECKATATTLRQKAITQFEQAIFE